MHVKTSESSIDTKLHISHIHHYVSAYTSSPEMVEQLASSIREALVAAKEDRECKLVTQDGEMFFIVYPSSRFSLCVPWKHYEVVE